MHFCFLTFIALLNENNDALIVGRDHIILLQFIIIFPSLGDLLYRKCNRLQVAVSDEVKEYFVRAVRDGKQLESYTLLAEIYKAENNLPKAIEMLENITQ